MEIYGTNGTTSLAFDDDGGAGNCSRAMATGLAAGIYFVRVGASQAFSPDQTSVYRLRLTVQ